MNKKSMTNHRHSGRKRFIIALVIAMVCLLANGTLLRAQMANLTCDQSWYYTSYGITSFVFNGTTVTSGVDWPGVAATVGTANTNMSQTFNAVPGQTCTFSINSQLSYYNQFGLYVDWNNNGSFDTSEYICNLVGYNASSYTGSFSVPSNVSSGPKRMRVNWDYFYAYGYYGTWGACQSYSSGYTQYYGDCEDYVLNVGYQNDGAISNISTTTAPPFAAGLNSITAVFTNNGVNTISSATVNYTIVPSSGPVINGTANLSSTLAVGASTTLLLHSAYAFPTVGTLSVSASVAQVNGGSDGFAPNNTTEAMLGAGLNGAYTIGGSSPDFASLSQAGTQLSVGGTIGPVTFNIRPGTYTESVYIANIPGNTVTKPIIFQSENGNKTSVVLQYSATASAAIAGTTSIGSTPTLRLNNADHISFRYFTIAALNTAPGLGMGIELVGLANNNSGCDNLKFENMVFNGVASSSATLGDVFFLAANNGYHPSLVISNCSFTQSSIPFYHVYSGSSMPSGIRIVYNSFTNFGYYGMRLEGCEAALVNGNHWSSSSSALGAGVVFAQHNGSFNFRKNKINLSSATGIAALSSAARNGGVQAVFANNFVRVGGTQAHGISCTSTNNVAVYHNTVYNTGSGAAFHATSASGVVALNNIFMNASSGPAIMGVIGINTNYNNLYSANGNVAVWNGNPYASMSAYRTASNQDQNSSNVNVSFVDASNNELYLNLVNTALYGIGSSSNGTLNSGIKGTVYDDINGTSRTSRSEIYMGAHQLVPVITMSTAPPASLTACAGQTISLSASATASFGSQISYQWLRNGTPLLDGVNGVSGANTSTLSVVNAQASLSAGDYVLRLSASGGADPVLSNIVSVTINSRISIDQQPVARMVCLGGEASLNVVATGTVLSYQWQKDGVNIVGATSPILALSNASFAMSGVYRVVLTGTCGTPLVMSADAAVLVASNTLIGRHPETNGAAVGSTGYLSIEVNAATQLNGYNPSFQWYQGTALIKDNGRISGATTSQLTIRNMQPADITQDYHCVVSGICGSQSSTNGGFYVSLISIQSQPQDQEVCSSNEAVLMVIVNSNIPNVSYAYQWKRNGKNLSNGVVYKGANANVLTVRSASIEEDGEYTCLITATPTSVTILSQVATLRVNSPPQISAQPENKSVCPGEKLIISVNASGGTIAYQWKQSGLVISGATNPQVEFVADPSLNGQTFACVLTNNCGTTTSSEALLTVNDKPIITVQPSAAAVLAGNTVKLSVSATGATAYQWKFRSNPIDGATNSVYTVEEFNSSKVGGYNCEVSNSCGTVASNDAFLNFASVEEAALDAGFRLLSVEPTPTASQATIRFSMPLNADARVTLSDVYGRELATLFDAVAEQGINSISFDATQLPSGVYSYTLSCGRYALTRTMLVVR